jgi:hypothetical protein
VISSEAALTTKAAGGKRRSVSWITIVNCQQIQG